MILPKSCANPAMVNGVLRVLIEIGSSFGDIGAALGRFSPPVPEAAGLQRESPEVVHPRAIETDLEKTAEPFAIEVVARNEVMNRRLDVNGGKGFAGAEKHPSYHRNAAGDDQQNNNRSSFHSRVLRYARPPIV